LTNIPILPLPDLAPGKSKPKKGEEVVSRIFCVGYSTFVSLVSGRVVACGLNSYGQLGLGHVDNISEPEEVEGLSIVGGIASITGGNQHVLALSNSGAVFSCGRGDSGQLGLGEVGQRSGAIPVGSSAFSPVQIDPAHFGGSAVVHISSNGCSSACVTARGELYTWGFGDSGQLGNNGNGDENIPYLVNKAAKTSKDGGASSSSSSSSNETRGIIIRACGLGGQHLVALGEGRGVETLPGGGSVSDSSCEVIEDPEKNDDDDDEGNGGDDNNDGDDDVKDKEEDEEDEEEDNHEDEDEDEEEEKGKVKKARTE
jgi:alpha-tubulin suppressor-like RCC1 family protein